MISPAIRALRERFAQAEIAILARPWVLDTLAGNPFFDRLIPYENPGRHAGLLGRVRLARELRRQKFDLAVLFQKAFDAAFLAALAGIPIRVGHDTDRRGFLLTERISVNAATERMHHVDFFLEVALACGCVPGSREPFFYLSDADRRWAAEFLRQAGTAPGARLVTIHTGGSKAPRAWHADRFAALARRLSGKHDLAPVIVGDAGDLAAARMVKESVPAAVIAAGASSVRGMAALIEASSLFVGNDSGPMHIAGALGTPVVGIFGPGIPEKTAPRGERIRFEAVTRRFPCAPCRQNFFRECEPASSGKPYCLEEIDVESVAAACDRVLRG